MPWKTDGESSSGYAEQSPVFFNIEKWQNRRKCFKKSRTSSSEGDEFLEKIYQQVLLQLRKNSKEKRETLTSYLKQVQAVKARSQRGQWLIMKTKGIITYMLKRRSEFIKDVTEGNLTIIEGPKEKNDESFFCNDVYEQESGEIWEENEFPEALLTNNDFKSMNILSKDIDTKIIPDTNNMDTSSYFSQHLFSQSENVNDLYKFSQENFKMLKDLGGNNGISEDMFKTPSIADNNNGIQRVYQLHENIDQDLKVISLNLPDTQTFDCETPDLTIEDAQIDNEMYEGEECRKNIFDKEYIVCDELKEKYTNISLNLPNTQTFDSETPDLTIEDAQIDNEMYEGEECKKNIFDKEYIVCDELKEKYTKIRISLEEWLKDLCETLASLEVDEAFLTEEDDKEEKTPSNGALRQCYLPKNEHFMLEVRQKLKKTLTKSSDRY